MIEEKFRWRREDSSAVTPPGDEATADGEAVSPDKPAVAVTRKRPILKATFPPAED